MSQAWSFAGRSYTELTLLAEDVRAGVSWFLVKGDLDGHRHLLQLWIPRPADRDFDRIKHTYLQRFTEAEPEDPVEIHFGFSDTQAWFLQRIPGQPLSDMWGEIGLHARQEFLNHLRSRLSKSIQRVWLPQAIGISPGRVFVPRSLGVEPTPFDAFSAQLQNMSFMGLGGSAWLWEQAPELSQTMAQPVRGRGQELTYLKTLSYGLTAPVPMERLIILHGEKGLGLDTLSRWSAATAESEGITVTRMRLREEDTAGGVLGRLATDLLTGVEAEFYAAFPDAARRLSRRVASFAFLRGGKKLVEASAQVEPEEIVAARTALDFAHHHRSHLIQILDLHAGTQDVLELIGQLSLHGKMPWFFSYGVSTPEPALKLFLASLQVDPHLAVVQLGRLEDADLRKVLEDRLRSHQLPESVLQSLCQACLGNPGLLTSMLERAQQDGHLVWRERTWRWQGDTEINLGVHENLVGQILEGRLKRLKLPTISLMRGLALVDGPLSADALGKAVGLAGDPFDEALASGLSFKLISLKEGRVALRDPLLRDLILSQAPAVDLRRIARSLLKALEQDGPMIVPAVRLMSLALDEATALAHVMKAIEQPPPGPLDAERVVHQAMELHPNGRQRARLWEYLADAWAAGTTRARIPAAGFGRRSPWELGLEALGLAQEALEEAPDLEDRAFVDAWARLMRKKALMEVRLRRSLDAQRSILAAAEALSDHPLHPEQARLRWALGKIHSLEGYTNKAVRAFEEGLQLLGTADQRAGRLDQITLLLELGRMLAQKAQLSRAMGMLSSAERMLEHEIDPDRMVHVQVALAHIRLAMGQSDAAYGYLREALQQARIQDDLALSGLVHMSIGTFRSLEGSVDTALAHLERAKIAMHRLGDPETEARCDLWKARTLAWVGASVEAELLMLQALGNGPSNPTAQDKGDMLVLQGDIAAFGGAWGDAARTYARAAASFEATGMTWRERLARLLQVQSLVRDGLKPGTEAHRDAWTVLESLKTPAESGESRWIEMEWHRAHALLLGGMELTETLVGENLVAWDQVIAAARDMRFHHVIIQACVASAEILMQRGERLGARSRLQEAQTSFHILWARIPETHAMAFLGRADIHRFQTVVASAGLPFPIPERADPLSDWTPTQTHFRAVPPS